LSGQKTLLARINAPNLDIGMTALFFGAVSLVLAVRPGPQRLLSLVPIPFQIFTGSRSPLVLTLLILPFALASGRLDANGRTRAGLSLKKSFLWAAIALGLFLLFANLISQENADVSARMTFLGDPGQLQEDKSTLGRIASLVAGFSVLISNPAGVPFSVVQLQTNMMYFGYPTFPHSTFLVILLIFGPFSPVVYYFILKPAFRLVKTKSPYLYCYLYFVVYSIIAGGIDPYFKPIFIYLAFFYLFLRSIREGLAAQPGSVDVVEAVPGFSSAR